MGETEENEFVADDWATLQRLLFQDSWNEELGRHRSPYVFRGMISYSYSRLASPEGSPSSPPV
ncbi:hypothetical protein E2L06_15945 [Haloterrigena sp. H1]|uniref:hypothetical protein n=1 Tax=Haloterrigena sp. H1 TaxID=2552943 RepID=UPI00110DE462|nr:hypothetical protein [Haloterrigena sp. H1]TMT81470.1 hypothetical protein E2L06_15945 [Haloterrigena sp. H1]